MRDKDADGDSVGRSTKPFRSPESAGAVSRQITSEGFERIEEEQEWGEEDEEDEEWEEEDASTGRREQELTGVAADGIDGELDKEDFTMLRRDGKPMNMIDKMVEEAMQHIRKRKRLALVKAKELELELEKATNRP